MGFFDRFRRKKEDKIDHTIPYTPIVGRHGKYDVYICYSTENSNIANEICHMLESNDLKCWMAPRNVLAGQNYFEQVIDAIKNSKIVLLIFSKHANDSRYVVQEIETAYKYEKPILCFKIDDFLLEGKLEWILGRKMWIDAYPDIESNYEQLVDSIKRLIYRQ